MENRRTRRFGDHKTNTVLALNGVVSKGGVGRSEETILLIKNKKSGNDTRPNYSKGLGLTHLLLLLSGAVTFTYCASRLINVLNKLH